MGDRAAARVEPLLGGSVIDQFVPAVIAWSQATIPGMDAEILDGFAAALEEVTSASAATLKQWRGRLFGLRQLLFERGQLPQPPQRGPSGKLGRRAPRGRPRSWHPPGDGPLRDHPHRGAVTILGGRAGQ